MGERRDGPRLSVWLFLLATGIPVIAAFVVFVALQWSRVTTEPLEYIELLRRHGHLEWTIGTLRWKYVLARDSLCLRARNIVLGSSRAREINGAVLGDEPICNLHVGGLDAETLVALARDFPAVAPGEPRRVYLALDHFFLWWWHNPIDEADLVTQPSTWRKAVRIAALLYRPDGAFSLPHLIRLWNEERGRDRVVWMPEGNGVLAGHHSRKRAGAGRAISGDMVNDAVVVHFETGGRAKTASAASARKLHEVLTSLTEKGYEVRVFWNPLVPAYRKEAERRYPELFRSAIETIDTVIRASGVARYIPPDAGLDASRFGCSERDYIDAAHVDLDCLSRFLAANFDDLRVKRDRRAAAGAARP